MLFDNIFYEVARVTVKVIELNNNIEMNSFSIFRINLQFNIRVQLQDIGKDYEQLLARVRRGRCSISIALTKLDFNVQAVSACICKQCHGRRKKLDHLPLNLKVLTDFFQRYLRCKRKDGATLLSRKNRYKKQLALN